MTAWIRRITVLHGRRHHPPHLPHLPHLPLILIAKGPGRGTDIATMLTTALSAITTKETAARVHVRTVLTYAEKKSDSTARIQQQIVLHRRRHHRLPQIPRKIQQRPQHKVSL